MTTTPTKKITRLVARSLREKAAGNAHYNKAAEALAKARAAGFKPNDQVVVTIFDDAGKPIETPFTIVDNFAGECAHKSARINRFELKKVPKFPRKPKTEAPAESEAEP